MAARGLFVMNEATITVLMQPPVECSPNWRGHTRSKAKRKAVAEFREEAAKATTVAVLQNFGSFVWVPSAPEIIVDIEIAWCCGRKRVDPDNAMGFCKPALDGIAENLGINDRKFRPGEVKQVRGGGMVTFTLREAA